jgi:hypothetical protein
VGVRTTRKRGLIFKVGTKEGEKLVVDRELLETNNDIIAQHGLSMEEYLIPVFLGKPVDERIVTITPEIINIQSLVQNCPNQTQKLILQQVHTIHKNLMDVEAARFVNIHPNDLIGRCIFSLAGLTKALILSSSIEKQLEDFPSQTLVNNRIC